MKILKFYADWCGPCKTVSNMITNAELETMPVIEEIDIDKELELTGQYGVRGVPTMILLDEDGNEVDRYVGAGDKNKLVEFLEKGV